jgi:hypothetical protein
MKRNFRKVPTLLFLDKFHRSSGILFIAPKKPGIAQPGRIHPAGRMKLWEKADG